MIHKHLLAISCLELIKDGTAHLFQQKTIVICSNAMQEQK